MIAIPASPSLPASRHDRPVAPRAFLTRLARPGLLGVLLATVVAVFAATPASAATIYYRTKLFDGGVSPYHSFRIPSIVRSTNGTLIAFAEGRVNDNTDWGNINLVCRRSTSDGSGWGPIILVKGGNNDYAYGNPTSVVDVNTGRIWLFFNRYSSAYTAASNPPVGYRKTFTTYSDDDGLTWSTEVDRTAALGGSGLGFDAVGPGVGIQKVKSPNIGQLVIPASGRNFYSNDHGATWAVKNLPSSPATSEATIVECLDGDLMRNDRAVSAVWSGNKRRFVSYGLNSTSFQTPYPLAALLDPHCEASVLRYNFDSPDRIYFLNSDSTVTRGKMKVRVSYDDGNTWPRERWLYVDNPHASPNYATPDDAAAAGKGGYSSMTKTADFCVGALVEINEDTSNSGTSHRSIDFHKFNLDFILNGQSEP